MEKSNVKILNEFNKTIKMGEDSYALVIEKATEEDFKNLLQKHSAIYEDFLHRVNNIYEELGEKPADTPVMEKMMGWAGIQMNTMTDSSNSHISEMLIQGAIMGVIACTKLQNTYFDMDASLHNMIKDFITLQYKVIDDLKPFLKD